MTPESVRQHRRVPRVVVVGGGITGLAVAWHLRDAVEVTVFEADDRIGGQIRTIDHAGVPFDVGADAFLARQPHARDLVEAAGLGDDVVAPLSGAVWLWVRGRLRPLPAGTVFGAPADLRALAASGVLERLALLRACLEPVVPRRHVPGDRTVADLVGERFGRDVVDVLVEPLLGGVYAGVAERLSARAAAPPIWEAAGAHRSLLRGLREHRARAAGDGRPVFQTVRGGLGRVVERLAGDLGARVETGARVVGIAPRSTPAGGQDGWTVEVERAAGDPGRGPRIEVADHVVLAVPAAAAAVLLAPTLPDAAREVAGIRAASVAVVALAYDRADAVGMPDGSGMLVPRSEGRLLKAATFSSGKWPHHAAAQRVVVRASVGRVDDERPLQLDDEALALRVDAELRAATGLRAPAVERRVIRWPSALPQYDLGHHARIERIRHAVARGPAGLVLAGAAFDGVGLASRAREARAIADELLAATTARVPPPAT